MAKHDWQNVDGTYICRNCGKFRSEVRRENMTRQEKLRERGYL